MSLTKITLSTNKSYLVINGDRRTIRQSEKGLVLKVELLNQQGASYDLTGKKLIFSENKQGGKIVIDDSSDAFKITDPLAGIFEYTLNKQVYSASGTAWFEIKQDDEVIDTSRDFYFDVIKDATYAVTNDNYVSSLTALEDYYKGVIKQSETSINSVISQFKSEVKKAIDTTNNQLSEKLENAQDQINTISQQRDSTIALAKQNFSDQLNSMQSDFTRWKSDQLDDFNAKVKELDDKILADDAKANQFNSDLNSMLSKVEQAKSEFEAVDFSKYATKSDIFSKKEIEDMVAEAGRVKTVDGISPDSSGNVQTDHYTRSEIDNKISPVNERITTLENNKLIVHVASSADVSKYPGKIVITDD